MADQEAGNPIPDALRIPDLFPDAMPFYQAFNDLSGSRNSGMSIGMIPFSEISSYLDEEQILSQEERGRWRHFITLIDAVWVSRQSESKKQVKASMKQQRKNSRGK